MNTLQPKDVIGLALGGVLGAFDGLAAASCFKEA
jgi:hypothetical protein